LDEELMDDENPFDNRNTLLKDKGENNNSVGTKSNLFFKNEQGSA
jgi:hypothetical protein